MNQFISFINKNKNSQEIKTIRQIIFLHSLWIAVLWIALGLTLDFIYGNTIFQRFGAILVGFSILHLFLKDDLLRLVELVENHNETGVLKEIESIQLDDANMLQYSSLEGAIYGVMLIGERTPQNATREEGENNLKLLIKARNDVTSNYAKLKATSNNEWKLAVLGTFIWAFGDWCTNFIYHCPWKLACM